MNNAQGLAIDAITLGLNTRVLGRRVVYRERIGSTNDLARELADEGEPEGTVVIADDQSAGRGRLGRSWIAPACSSLLISLILRPGATSPTMAFVLAPSQVARVTMAISLGVCDAIRSETGLHPRIKWPNDLLLAGKKFAGILAESSISADKIDYVIVGLGINVNFHAKSIIGLPPDATTIADELGGPFSRERLIHVILQRCESYYMRVYAGENLRDEWTLQLATLGQRIRVRTEAGIEEGIAERVEDDGALLLRRTDGSILKLVAGDVTLSQS